MKDKLIRLVTKKLFDYEINTNNLQLIESTFLGSSMLKSINQIWGKAVQCRNVDEDIEELAEETYQETCVRAKKYLKEKLHIDVADLISISALYYEGAEVNGNLYFALENIQKEDMQVYIEKETDQITLEHNNWRKIRKWLEMTSNSEPQIGKGEQEYTGLLLVNDNGKWKVKGIITEKSSSTWCFRICFVRHMEWRMYKGRENILNYTCGRFSKPLTDKKKEYMEKLDCVLKTEPKKAEKKEVLWPFVENAMAQKHGTILVILFGTEAEKEADRICKESTGTRASGKLTNAALVKRITAVDGAILINEEGDILAYGVILDAKEGIEVEPEPGRGSRFLSGKKYAESLKIDEKKGLVVIVSEDGMINFYTAEKGGTNRNEN